MSFRLFGFDVEIRLSFWLFTAALALVQLHGDPDADQMKRALMWVPIVLVSILVHELGHAFAIRRYGLEPYISLHWMGGTTHWRELLPISRKQHIIISLAGPFAGFAFGALVFGVSVLLARANVQLPPHVNTAIGFLLFANILWGIVNLIPVLPFDGGHVLEHALGPKRVRATLWVSGVVGAGVALLFLKWGSIWGAYLFGSAAMRSFGALRELGSLPRVEPKREEDGEPDWLRDAQRALERGEFDSAIELAMKSVAKEDKPTRRLYESLNVIAWAHLSLGRPDEAQAFVEQIAQIGDPDVALVANVALAQGRDIEARALFEARIAAGDDRKEVFGPLVQLLLRSNEVGKAADVAFKFSEQLSVEDLRHMAELVEAGGAHKGAAVLAEKAWKREGVGADGYFAARAYARAGDHQRARELLKASVKAGFQDRSQIERDRAVFSVEASWIEHLFTKEST